MVEVPSDDERSREELPFATAEALVPPHKQKRVWFGGAAILGTIVALIVILPGVGTQPPIPPAPTSPMPSLSLAPSSSFMPSMFPSAIPSENPSHLPSYQPSSSEHSQKKALIQLYTMLSGENWTKHYGWDESTSSNMCGWYGVVCRPDDVEEVLLPANNLMGNIDNITLLDKLIYLEKLDLDSNSIHGNLTAFSATLSSLSNLKYVDLRLNELTGSIPSEVCDSIGGMELRVDCDIECDCCNHDVLCEECTDVPGWLDLYGDNCAWYVCALFLQCFQLLNSLTFLIHVCLFYF